MSRDIALAFAHPEERARASAEPPVPDRISLRDHVVSMEIGAFQQERGRRQRLSFNVVVEVRPATGIADDVDRILSYDRITEAIEAETSGDRLNLLETLAENVAARILAEPQALRVFVRIEKLDLGPGALGVEIVREREGAPLRPVHEPRPDTVVVFLSGGAIAADRLAGWLDGIERAGVPAILCVDRPALPAPEVAHAAAQRRIDLLAIEQNAWVIAARDPRCVVVASRTELEWAAGKGRISVWAPSKMVLDAADPPDDSEPATLALWLARELGASRVVAVGVEIGAGAESVPVDAADLLAG